MAGKRRKLRLPRVTVLALSARELQRFSENVERANTLAVDLAQLVGRLGQLVEDLEKRGVAASKANATRKGRPGPAAAPGLDQADGNGLPTPAASTSDARQAAAAAAPTS